MPMQSDMNSVRTSRLQPLCDRDFINATSSGTQSAKEDKLNGDSGRREAPREVQPKHKSPEHQYIPQLARLVLFGPSNQSALLSVELKKRG